MVEFLILCKKCMTVVALDSFCSSCGARLWSDARLEVKAQGVTKEFIPNGSYDIVKLGRLSLDEVLDLMARIPQEYHPTKEDWCPVHLLIGPVPGRGGNGFTISYIGDGLFYFFDEKDYVPQMHLIRREVEMILKDLYISSQGET